MRHLLDKLISLFGEEINKIIIVIFIFVEFLYDGIITF